MRAGEMRSGGLTRRAVLAASAAAFAGPVYAAAPSRIVAFDWGIVETLLALGIVPVGIAEREGYGTWVMEPALPPGVADVGLRVEPNLEAVARLKPDLIVLTPQIEALAPVLSRIAPTLTLAIFAPEGDIWARAAEVAVALAAASGRPQASASFLSRADAVLGDARQRVFPLIGRPLYLASFVDARHVRIYAKGSLFDAVLGRLGLTNAFAGGASFWGFSTLGLEHLAAPADASLLLFEPVPREARVTMERGPLWQRLPAVAGGRVALLPPVWSFGGLASAMRFARLLGERADDPALSGSAKGGAGG